MDLAMREEPARLATWQFPCTHLTHGAGKRSPATYWVDMQRRAFMVECGGTFDPPEMTCSFSDIEDIYTISDGKHSFPSTMISSLQPDELHLLFMVLCSNGPGGQQYSVCLLAQSPPARDIVMRQLHRCCFASQQER